MKRISLVALIFGLCSSASARELLGEFHLTDLYLEPSFYFREPQQSSFRLDNSFIGFHWRYDDAVSTVFQVGSASLVGKPFFYGPETREFTVTQAFGQYDSSIGEFRFGLVPLCYGFEAGYTEDQLPFPRTLIYQRSVIPSNDLGVTYAVHSRGFYTEMTAHNGETAVSQDNQTWFTARWGWRNKYGLDVGFSGITGRTTPESTADTSQTPPVSRSTVPEDFDGLQNSRFRLLNFYGETVWERLRIMMDIHSGLIHQETDKPMRGGHLDLQYNLSDRGDILARYDEWCTNTSGAKGIERQILLGMALKSLYRNSVLSLFATRDTIDNSSDNPSHGIKLVWKLTPNF